MTIIPVLDILNGVVVRGVAGRREEYRPIQSRMVDTPEPLAVARAFRREYGLRELYVADLDGLLRGRPNLAVVRELSDDGFRLMVDAGVRNIEEGGRLIEAGAHRIIVALETSSGPDQISDLVQVFGPDCIIFSLDLIEGRLLTNGTQWVSRGPQDVIDAVVALRVRSLIVLDLASVGMANGLTTLPLCRVIAKRHPSLEVITGGGVRSASDLREAEESGVDGLLIASALHTGELQRELGRTRRNDDHAVAAPAHETSL